MSATDIREIRRDRDGGQVGADAPWVESVEDPALLLRGVVYAVILGLPFWVVFATALVLLI